MEKIEKAQTDFFHKINKINQLLCSQSKTKREKIQITNIRSERWYITKDPWPLKG